MTQQWNTEDLNVRVTVNGEGSETVASSLTLGEVVRTYSSRNGLRTVTVTVNGAVTGQGEASKTLAELNAQSIEIRTKDQRA